MRLLTATSHLKMKSLNIIQLNACSLLCHLDEIWYLAAKLCPNILAISESWLGPSVPDAEVSFAGSSIYLSITSF